MNNETRKETQVLPKDVRYVGADDLTFAPFENQYPVQPMGVSYNSYLILDEKVAVMDSVDARAADEWLAKLAHELDGRRPDYLVISHMEPDHSGSILCLAERYPEMQLVGNAKTFAMLRQFFGADAPSDDRLLEVGEGETLPPRRAYASFYARPDGSLAGGDGRLRGNREDTLLRRRLRALRCPLPHRRRAVGTAGAALLLQHCRQVRRAGTGTAEKRRPRWRSKRSARSTVPC